MKRFAVLLLFLAACAPNVPIETGPPIEVLFCGHDDCVGRLVEMLGKSEAKCALYDVSLPAILAALKGVEWKTEDGKSPLMHNKFCVFDENTVWTGSWNPTRGTRANNVVIIQSSALARNYLEEFNELPGGYRRVIHPVISYNNHLIENYFCPEDDCKENVLEELESAKQGIVFMLADLTDREIIAELQRDDVFVEGIIDKAEHDALKALPFAKSGNIHNKVFIVDRSTVITGSYNPTRNGDERNDENILIIHDQQIAGKFLEEYKMLTST